MKIILNTDRLTTILGLVAAFLVLQEELWPNLMSEEQRNHSQAIITSLFGFLANKNKKIILSLNGEEERKEQEENKNKSKGTSQDEE